MNHVMTLRPLPGAPMVLSCGLGVDSVGALVGLVAHGIRPDAIVFSDPGNEHPDTYKYIPVLNAYLRANGFPELTVVRRSFKKTSYTTLEENCLSKRMLPSIAYGTHKHSCSLKFKVAAIDTWINGNIPEVRAARKSKVPVTIVRVIGYDASAADCARSKRFAAKESPKKGPVQWHYWYPLQQWGWDRERTIREILSAGLPLPPKSACFFCLAGETEVVTRGGIRPIRELAGGTHHLLVPAVGTKGGLLHRGSFQEVAVHSFGAQSLWEVKLRRGPACRTIRTTAEHRWFLAAKKSHQWSDMASFERTTESLRVGDKLRTLRATAPAREGFMSVAAAQGFVFGDGSRPSGREGPASVTFYAAKDEALLPLFSGTTVTRVRANGKELPHIHGLPRFWKDLPPLSESRSFLLSWLSGYFAADGSVSVGGAPTVESASPSALEYVRSIAAVCGVGCGFVQSRRRKGFGEEPSALYRVTLRASDLPAWFFLNSEHKRRATARSRRDDMMWTVEAVAPLGITEEVFCAVVPGVGAFGLGGDLMTGNCPSQRPYELLEVAVEHPDLAWRIIQMERTAGPNLDALDGLWRAPVKGTRGGTPKPGSMTEFLLDWMLDGRAYKSLPRLDDPRIAPTEVQASAVVGGVYRRSLPVVGNTAPKGFDPEALTELAERGMAAARALRDRYETAYGSYHAPASIADASIRLHRAGKARATNPAGFEAALAHYINARRALGADDTILARSLRRYDATVSP